MKHILVIRFSSIGDIVLSSPVVRQLKHEGYHVSVVTKKSFSSLWINNPYVDELILIDKLNNEALTEIKNKKFDIVVDLHNNSWSKKIKSFLDIETYTLSKSNVKKALLVWTKRKQFKVSHIVDRYLETIEPLVKENDDFGLDFFEDDPSDKIENLIHTKYAVFVIGGQHQGKMMSKERMLELCQTLSITLILLGGPDDSETGLFIQKNTESNIINYAGQLSLMDSVNLIKNSIFVISHDTGLMHIASAYKKDIISLWGATTPELGFSAYKPGKRSISIEYPHFLRPTSKLGKQRVFKSIRFIDRIPLHVIQDAILKLWN